MAGSTVSDTATRLNRSFQKPTQSSGNQDPVLFPIALTWGQHPQGLEEPGSLNYPMNSNEVGLCDQGQNKEPAAHSPFGKNHHTICLWGLQVQAALDISDDGPRTYPKNTVTAISLQHEFPISTFCCLSFTGFCLSVSLFF